MFALKLIGNKSCCEVHFYCLLSLLFKTPSLENIPIRSQLSKTIPHFFRSALFSLFITIYSALQYFYDFATSFLLRDFQYSYARKPLATRCYTCQVGFNSPESVSNQNSGRSGWKRSSRCQFNIGSDTGGSRQSRPKSVSESFSATGKSKKVVHSDDVKGRSWANHFQF